MVIISSGPQRNTIILTNSPSRRSKKMKVEGTVYSNGVIRV